MRSYQNRLRNTADNLKHFRDSRSVDILYLLFSYDWPIMLMKYASEGVVFERAWVKSLEIHEYYLFIEYT